MTGAEVLVYFAAAAAAASVATAVVQAQALSEQADAAKAAADYNKQVAELNAKQSVDNAAVNEQSAAYKSKLLLANEKAVSGASGVDPLDGSPLAVRDTTTQQTTLDALKIRYGGATQSTAYINQGNLDLMQGANTARALNTQATGAIIGGIGNAAGIYATGARYGNSLSTPPSNQQIA